MIHGNNRNIDITIYTVYIIYIWIEETDHNQPNKYDNMDYIFYPIWFGI